MAAGAAPPFLKTKDTKQVCLKWVIPIIKYMITDNRGSYIRYDLLSQKYVSIRSKDFASTWSDRAKANNILNNCIPGNMRKKYFVKEIEEKSQKEDAPEKKKKEFPVQEAKKIMSMEIHNSNTQEWEDGFQKVESFFVDVDERKKELAEKIGVVDREISDIQHYIEFNNLNAYQGWLAASMLKNRLKQRREYKDELFLLSRVHRCSLSEKEISDVRETSIQLKNRKYSPRVLKELF